MFDHLIAESLVHDLGDSCATSIVVCRRLHCATVDWLHNTSGAGMPSSLHLNQSPIVTTDLLANEINGFGNYGVTSGDAYTV